MRPLVLRSMVTCTDCGADLDRSLSPFEEEHIRRSDALDEGHLAHGAEHISVDVTRGSRVAMNRIRQSTGMTLCEQVRRALDEWLPLQERR